MKKFKLLILFLLLFIPINIIKADSIKVYLFYGDGCPHCAEEEEFFDKYLKENNEVTLVKYEVWGSSENRLLLSKVQDKLNDHRSGVPFLVIGDNVILGYMDGVTDELIKDTINEEINNRKYEDIVEKVVNNEKIGKEDSGEVKKEEPKKEAPKKKENNSYTLPLLGKVNAKTVSLPLLSLVLGLVDGFNPCAMWILIFLMSMLIGMKNKKKLILYGSVFLLTSGLFYFMLMFTWLNVIASISISLVFRIIIAIFALIAGVYNLYNYYKSLKKDDGCTVTNQKQRKTIMEKIKKFTREQNVLLALIGIVVLAIGVNFVELLCSAGLPVLFTEILSLNKVNGFMGIIYNFIYIIFFMLDDFIIFFIAAKTMNIKVISTKYSKYSHLIAGIIMLIIGILLIVKPGWVMFNF